MKDDDEDLDEDFPLGSGTADTSITIQCPYCAEPVEITLDPGGGPQQQYVEDCEICCRPWNVSVEYDDEGSADVSVTALDD